MKIRKNQVSGRVEILLDDVNIDASIPRNYAIFKAPKGTNEIWISPNGYPVATDPHYVIPVDSVTATIIAGIETSFSGDINQLIDILSTDFFFDVEWKKYFETQLVTFTLYESISTGTTGGSIETQTDVEILKDTFGGADLDICGLSTQNYPTNESIFDTLSSVVTANFNPVDTPPDWQLDNLDSGSSDYALLFKVRGTRENLSKYLENYPKYLFYEETSRSDISGGGVQSVAGDGVGGTSSNVVMTFPVASEVVNAFDKATDNASDITMASSSQTVQNKIVNIQNETDENTEICTSAASFISTITQNVGTQTNPSGTNIQINLTNILGPNNLSYTLNSGSVLVPVAGWYKVSLKGYAKTSSNNRQNTAFVVKRNLVDIVGTFTAGYMRNPANNDGTPSAANIIPQFQFALNDIIGLYAIVQGDGNQSTQTVAQECVLTLEYIGT